MVVLVHILEGLLSFIPEVTPPALGGPHMLGLEIFSGDSKYFISLELVGIRGSVVRS